MRKRHHAPYPAEFRRRMLDLVKSGRSAESLAREFKLSAVTIRKWVVQADLDAGRRTDGLTTEEQKELAQLKRENRMLREEREILKKAAAWFAKESTSGSKKGVNVPPTQVDPQTDFPRFFSAAGRVSREPTASTAAA